MDCIPRYPYRSLSEIYLDRLQSQEDLIKLIDASLGDAEAIRLNDFKILTETVSSAIYLCVYG